MRALATLLLGVPLLAACPSAPPPSATASASTIATPAGKASIAKPLQIGEHVLVAHQTTSFREGVVTKVVAGSLQYRYGSPAEPASDARRDEVMLTRAWRLGAAIKPQPGQHLICQVDARSWVGCRIDSVSGDLIVATDPLAKKHNLQASRLVAPGAATRADIETLFSKQRKARRFDQALFRALARAAKDQPCPKIGATVAARYGDFHRARVRAVVAECQRLEVEWLDRPKARRTVERFDVVALEASPKKPKQGDFALRRAAKKRPWQAVRVTELGEGYAIVESRVGSHTKSTGQRLVVIGP
jgi:hypothetical protein